VTTTEQASRPSAQLVERLARPTADEIAAMDAWWRANNYLTVGQIYLMANPLLREPLRSEHIKPRLLGHWGTSPGLSFIYVHASRLIRETGQQMIYLAGPGHGGPALVAAGYLEGTYTEIYSRVTQDEEGMRRLFRQFSAPAGIPSPSRSRLRGRSTRAASSATCWCTRSGR
jgi:xylulose-5-phosphate/fructose-6-phosphate phosphoketolase